MQLGLAKKHRRAGNAARDRKDWTEAARCYREYLRFNPNDAAIWIQFGHMLKEDDRLEEAEQAYGTAAVLAPNDVELRIHYADLLRRLEFTDRASEVLLEAMRIEPTWGMAEELTFVSHRNQALSLVGKSGENSTKNIRYLELKDLFQYLGLHTTVTGITRVVLGLIKYLLDDLDAATAEKYEFVHMFGDAEAVALISKEKLRRLIELATAEAGGDLPAMKLLIADMRKTAKLMHLKAGDLYFMPGAFWEFVDNPGWLLSMKQKGVYIGGLVYDLIPLTHSHFCMATLNDMFNVAFADTARFHDFTLTISEFVATQVKDFLQANGIAPFPITALPLAHELHFEPSNQVTAEPLRTSPLWDICRRPFVLCVCTIEARKNHIYLFYIWQQMIDAGLDVPDLVFVGRPGWRVADLLGQIEASRNLDGRLHIVHGLSDTDLAMLYRRCLFTVFPSFVEGWGLPVGESLAYGKVCVASSTTSIPEVGGEFTIYIDPYNLHSGYEVISNLISQPAIIKEMEEKIRANFVARTWKDVGRDFFNILDRECASLRPTSAANRVYAPLLKPGRMAELQWLQDAGRYRREYTQNPARLIFVDGWHHVEGSGIWIRDRAAKLRFNCGYEAGQELSILLLVSASDWVRDGNVLRVWASNEFIGPDEPAGDYHQVRAIGAGSKFWIKIKGKVGDSGIVTVQFQLEGPTIVPIGGSLPVAVRMHSIGHSASDDYDARQNLLNHIEEKLFISIYENEKAMRIKKENERLMKLKEIQLEQDEVDGGISHSTEKE